MTEPRAPSLHGMHMLNDYLIVPVKNDIDDGDLLNLRKAVLNQVQKNRIKGVLIDVTAVRLLDGFAFSMLKETAQMVTLLGPGVVFVGFQPGVASALVDLNVDTEDLQTALTMDEGLGML